MAKSAKAPRTTGKRAVTSRSPRRDAQPAADDAFRYCAVPETPEVVLPRGIDPDRARAIIVTADKWVNGTVIHYYFFNRNTDGSNVRLANGTVEFRTWVGAESQRKAVRDAFAAWKALGIGLVFKEVDDREEAELRIGFMRGDGAWSYIGTQALNRGPNERTINFGWNLTTPDGADTALHEIGHALGLPHEHQNPNAGIVWDEEAVYASLARPPNSWDRAEDLPQHHPQDRAGHGAGFGLGPGLDHALPVRRRAHQAADVVQKRPPAARRPVVPRPHLGPFVLSRAQR